MRGSVQLTFNEFIDDLGFDGLFINVAGQERYVRFIDSNRIYTTPINIGEVCEIDLGASDLPIPSSRIVVYRVDYTTDDVAGDNGIKETYIGENIASSGSTVFSFTATTRPDAYAFEYRVECYTDGCFPNNNAGFNNIVFNIKVQPDDKVIVAGNFISYSGTPVQYLCRLNPNGSLDTTFYYTPTTNGYVSDILLLPDGSMIIKTGDFRLRKIKSDGSVDTSFNIGSYNVQIGIDEELSALLPDGKILFVGYFPFYTSAGQTSTKYGIVRLNPNGTIDNTFNQFGVGFTPNVGIRDVVVQPDGKILLAGENLTNYNGVSLGRPGLIRLNPDGSLDTTFILNTSTNVIGIECELQSDGKILFYNDLGGYNGNATRRLVRLNPDGSLDGTFPNTALSIGVSPSRRFSDIVVDNLDRIYLLGTDLIYSGTSVPSLIRLTPNGTVDSSFSDGFGFLTPFIAFPGVPLDMELNNAGSIYVGGDFVFYFNNTTISVDIMKIRNNGTPFLC
jgi:uncharacterized delta-60 repeat protein